jgi:hypothetical protein
MELEYEVANRGFSQLAPLVGEDDIIDAGMLIQSGRVWRSVSQLVIQTPIPRIDWSRGGGNAPGTSVRLVGCHGDFVAPIGLHHDAQPARSRRVTHRFGEQFCLYHRHPLSDRVVSQIVRRSPEPTQMSVESRDRSILDPHGFQQCK